MPVHMRNLALDGGKLYIEKSPNSKSNSKKKKKKSPKPFQVHCVAGSCAEEYCLSAAGLDQEAHNTKTRCLMNSYSDRTFFKDKRCRKWFWRKYESFFTVVGEVVTGDLLV